MKKSMMGRSVRRIRSVLAIAAALAGSALPAAAAEGSTTYYYEGGRRVELTAQSGLVADFRQPRAVALEAGGRPTAQRVAGDSMMRIERLPDTEASALAAAGVGRSPVFRQGGAPSGRLMALPGGVLVKFKPDWSPSQIDQWLAARGLPPARPLAIGPGWAVVDTASGQAALDAANRLHESGEVLSASPNWWTQTTAR